MNIKPEKKPNMTPRQRRCGPTWFCLAVWGDWPSEEVGGFPSEDEAQKWIDHQSAGWLTSRFASLPFV